MESYHQSAKSLRAIREKVLQRKQHTSTSIYKHSCLSANRLKGYEKINQRHVTLVQAEMKQNPFRPGYFVFCNKRRRLLKIRRKYCHFEYACMDTDGNVRIHTAVLSTGETPCLYRSTHSAGNIERFCDTCRATLQALI
jgi:hypothetical protein